MVYLRGNDMEKKQRYCPSCGAKTNDAVCEICGRHTKPISERYHEKNLYIVEDDIASNEERQYRNEQKEKKRQLKMRLPMSGKHSIQTMSIKNLNIQNLKSRNLNTPE